MIDVAKITYRFYAVLSSGKQLDITDAVTSAGWDEDENEISTRITMTVANVKYDKKPLSSTIVPNTIIVIMADIGSGEKEVARGYVVEWGPTRDSGGNSFTLTAYDELFNLQQSQDDRYITAGTGTKSAICAVFNDWGIPIGSYKGPNVSHAKTLFKEQYLSDIILSLLDDAEKHESTEAETGTEYYVNTTSGLNIRSGPSTSYQIIGGMEYKTSFFFDGQTSGAWMHGTGNGVTGWSYGSYLTKK